VKSASLVYDGRHTLHDDPSHPETSSRATKMWEALEESGLAQRCHKISGREATREELVLAHTEEHIDLVNQGEALMDGSTYFTVGTPLAARVAAGCVLEMTRQVWPFSSDCVNHI
jgi:acetoin utilization deacetylase AcuC-like enzyme